MPFYCQHAGCSRCTMPRSDYCDIHQFGATDVAIQSSETGAEFNPSEATRKDGKVRVELVFEGMPRALMELGRIMTWAIEGKGYKEGDWINVPNNIQEYRGAMLRHDLSEARGETHDPESKRRHAAHTAWNAIARLEMLLRQDEQEGKTNA